MMQDVTIAPYSEANRDAHRAFAEKEWPKKRRRREERYLRWKFRGPNAGPVDGLLLALSGGQVVGQLGLIPATLREGQAIHACQWACDLMVDSDLRRAGIGSKLFGAAMSRGVVTLGSNPSPAARSTMLRLGFEESIGPWTMLLPLDLSHMLSWRVPAALSGVTPRLARLASPYVAIRSRRLSKNRNPAARCDWREVAPLIAERQSHEQFPKILHDHEFLEWRCTGLRDFSAELEALRTPSGAYAIYGPARPYLYVYDWAAGSYEDVLSIFAAAHQVAKAAKCLTIQALAQNEQEREWLAQAGFQSMRRRWTILRHPPKPVSAQPRFRYCIYDSDGNL